MAFSLPRSSRPFSLLLTPTPFPAFHSDSSPALLYFSTLAFLSFSHLSALHFFPCFCFPAFIVSFCPLLFPLLSSVVFSVFLLFLFTVFLFLLVLFLSFHGVSCLVFPAFVSLPVLPAMLSLFALVSPSPFQYFSGLYPPSLLFPSSSCLLLFRLPPKSFRFPPSLFWCFLLTSFPCFDFPPLLSFVFSSFLFSSFSGCRCPLPLSTSYLFCLFFPACLSHFLFHHCFVLLNRLCFPFPDFQCFSLLSNAFQAFPPFFLMLSVSSPSFFPLLFNAFQLFASFPHFSAFQVSSPFLLHFVSNALWVYFFFPSLIFPSPPCFSLL